MDAYIFVVVWILSNALSLFILHRRGVKPNLLWQMFGVILGPLAIPFAFFIGHPRSAR
jgi:hypothetical protein